MVWNAQSETLVTLLDHGKLVSSMAWHESDASISILDMSGQLSIWDNVVIAANYPPTQKMAPSTSKQSAVAATLKKPLSPSLMDTEAAHSPEQSCASKSNNRDDDDDDDDESMNDNFSDLEEFVEDDADVFGLKQLKKAAVAKYVPPPATFENAPFMDPFQPNSTKSNKGTKSYLVLDMTGIVTSINQGTHRAVDIVFHDTSSHRPVRSNIFYLGPKVKLIEFLL